MELSNVSRLALSQHTRQAQKKVADLQSSLGHNDAVQDRYDSLGGFLEDLDKTAGSNLQELSSSRTERWASVGKKALTAAGLAVGLGVAAVVSAAAAPALATGLGLAAGATLLTSGGVAAVAKGQESEFQKNLQLLGQEVVDGKEPSATSGLQSTAGSSSGSDDWTTSWVANPANPASPLNLL